MTRVLILSVVLVGTAIAQEEGPRVAVRARGAILVADLEARDASLFTVFSRLAERLGRELRIEPRILDRVRARSVVVRVTDVPVPSLVRDLAGAYDLTATLDDALLRVDAVPEAEAEKEAWLRTHALVSLKAAALLGDGGGDERFDAGVMHFAGGEDSEAIAELRAFFTNKPEHPRAAEARLMAGYAALRTRQWPQVLAFVGPLDDSTGTRDQVMRGQLMMAQAARELGEGAEALVRLERVIDASDVPLRRAHAILLEADLFYADGNAKGALETLTRFDAALQRDLPDLADHLPYYRGLCLVLAGRFLDAIPHLQLAALVAQGTPEQARATLELVRCYLGLDDPLTAALAVRTALKLTGGDPERKELELEGLELQAEIYSRLGVTDLALASYQRLVLLCGRPTERAQAALRAMGTLLFEEQRFVEARDLFVYLRRQPGLQLAGAIMAARCEMGLQRYPEAIAVLDRIDHDTLDAAGRSEVARLRARCYLALGEYTKASLAFQGWREDS